MSDPKQSCSFQSVESEFEDYEIKIRFLVYFPLISAYELTAQVSSLEPKLTVVLSFIFIAFFPYHPGTRQLQLATETIRRFFFFPYHPKRLPLEEQIRRILRLHFVHSQ